ncbi:MAG: N-acetylglucosamine-6-phosphate deacetylase [Treponema sp.]|jgi:N-acetylglucosamine-6-phosphate deacetylase|nr:N-acetylglucosamine-6-phosphate deacetylase [Treponema sp.]
MSGSVCLHNGTVLTGFSAMEQCAVMVEDGLVSDVYSQKRFEKRRFDSGVQIIDAGGGYIAPGFIDTHIHGIGGYGTEDTVYCGGAEPAAAGMETALAMSRLLAARGVTAFNPTLYPAEPAPMLQAVRALSSAMGKEQGARIMGLHLEGPFISPSRLGVQRPETVRPVDLDFMEKLWDASGGRIVNMTVAPELKGMRELALYCVKKGIVLQAGHTDASYGNMVEGMQAGILHSTHLFNAMSRLDHRNPNAVGAILIHSEMSCEIIADNFHIHPDLLQLLLRDKPIEKIVLITDGLKPTEQKEGPFLANGEEVVFHDGAFHRVSDGVIAGSGLTMIRGIQNLVCAGFSMVDAVKTATINPARVMRYTGQGALIPGKLADITVFDKNFNIRLVMIGGKIVQGEDNEDSNS